MKLQTIYYHNYEQGLPQENNYILGHTDDSTIIVYQAFNDSIANYAIENQKFGGPAYSFSRMTWIKPNFLWMMYRSGWAQKENQNRILAIEISLEGFYKLLEDGVLTHFDNIYASQQDWQEQLNNSDVRIQWDPDHNLAGDKLKRRAIQIGIKGKALEEFNNQYIKSITDITAFVNEQYQTIQQNDKNNWIEVISERIVEVSPALKKKLAIPDTFISDYILQLIQQFETTGEIDHEEFEKLLNDKEPRGDERRKMVEYIKNYKNLHFSRYLLQKAIDFRKSDDEVEGNDPYICTSPDLLMFSYFVSKNKTTIDFDLIMEAKCIDFDTWCGFDGEMIFYTLGFEGTRNYLQNNVEKFSQNTVDYFLGFTKEYLYDEIAPRAFWYLWY
ncbi:MULTISPECIES: DUF4291 domain-containing protein [unclassified Arcicella]|uniref:DUF4291 domain-containing protein n=1 Tax=unclassified Arcicella TaxID=2644986 RepID=UPI0028615DF0|nr:MULTISPECIES: DUF4291 domain-containing protein [unclassified Arcicella]MDR6564599.1 hypothetical protein [Arcicella sp. BE51]MDR6814473.1 hypothetical protein [Arcicella sp. BE140]MDR6825771.1 hypothetical protein [Arcicella sp. BE139]